MVRGTIGDGRSYLSDDQREVLTDHHIENPVVLFEREVVESKEPGPSSSIVVTVLGGTISINGLTYRSIVGGLPPLTSGRQGLFLLRRVGSRHVIAGHYYGAFDVTEGVVRPMTAKRGFAKEYDGVPVDDAVKDLVAALRSSKRGGLQ